MTKRTFKGFRIQQRYIDMLEEMVNYSKGLPENIESNFDINERHIIEEAIEHYHAQMLGGDVMTHLIPQLVDEMANKLDLKFDRFFELFAQVTNESYINESINKELLGMIILLNDFNLDVVKPDNHNIEMRAYENEVLYDHMRNIVIKKMKENE